MIQSMALRISSAAGILRLEVAMRRGLEPLEKAL